MIPKFLEDKEIAGYTCKDSLESLTEKILGKCKSEFPSIPVCKRSIYLAWIMSRLQTFCVWDEQIAYTDPEVIIYRWYWSPQLGLLKLRLNTTLGIINVSTRRLSLDVDMEAELKKRWNETFKIGDKKCVK